MEQYKSLNLGFVYHTPFWEENGEVWTTFSPIGRYVEALAQNFYSVTLISPARKPEQTPLYRVRASNLRIFHVKSLENVQSYYLHLLHFYNQCLKIIKDIDILNIRMPTLIGFPAFIAARIHQKPTFLVIVGDNLEFLKFANYTGIKKLAARFVGWFQDLLMKQMIKRCPTFTNGQSLRTKYMYLNKKIQLMRSSTINEADIVPEFRDTCQRAPYKILTVATITPRKGTSMIPRIIAGLRESGIQVDWKYVGNIEGNSGRLELEKTLQAANELGIQEYLSFHPLSGFDKLLPLYRESDIFVLPTYMEGIPRVLLEAQASGLPVITTRVGGIPGAVEDGVDGILVTSGNSQEMVNAINRIIIKSGIRNKLIQNGIETARKHTLEYETQKMLENVLD